MRFFLPLVIGIFIGYFWAWNAMKHHIASPETCKLIYQNDDQIFNKFKHEMYNDIFKYVDENKIFYYFHNGKYYIISKK